MRFYLILLSVSLFFCCCSAGKIFTEGDQGGEGYEVYKIESIDSYYIIYLKKEGQNYKVISKRGAHESKKCDEIQVGGSYSFLLNAYPENKSDDPLTNSSLLVNCYMFDTNTKICKEPGINGLYTTTSVKGLCYIKR